MRRKTKCGIVVTVVMLLASAWIWRYVALNRLFEENYLPFPVEYAMGKEVEYGKNRIFFKCSSEGYSVSVQGKEILTFGEYAKKYGFSPSAYEDRYGSGTTPDAIVEVTVNIKNVDDASGESCVPLQEFILHGDVWSFGVDSALFLNSNPNWDPSVMLLSLDVGSECTVVLPFSIVDDLMPKNIRDHFDATDMWLLATNYPERTDICLTA